MSRRLRAVLAIGLAVATAFAGYAITGTAGAASSGELGPGLVTVRIEVHYSHFSVSTLHVHRGTLVRFLVDNQDPIDHELIVGYGPVHSRHEHGREHVHPPIPGEVSLPPGQVGETFFRFDQPGRVLFACHMPGHFAYGMRGWIIVDST